MKMSEGAKITHTVGAGSNGRGSREQGPPFHPQLIYITLSMCTIAIRQNNTHTVFHVLEMIAWKVILRSVAASEISSLDIFETPISAQLDVCITRDTC